MSGSSLIDLGELSKPATVLIEKMSDAVGVVYKPHQIVRLAEAEAKAEKIRANSKTDVQDIHHRAMRRLEEEEVKRQKNMESIIQKALPNLKDDAKPESIEDDWLTHFFDKCRLISDSEMQNLWSGILSGEANIPGSYSKRTIDFLSVLEKKDAELFTQLCTFGWMMDEFIPVIYCKESEIYEKHGINFASLNHLESIGIIKLNVIPGFSHAEMPKNVCFQYYNQSIILEFQKETDNELAIGNVLLTKIGKELAPICDSYPDKEFYEYICDRWKKEGLIKDNVVQ